MSQTGLFTFFLFLGIMAVVGTVGRATVLAYYRRAHRRTHAELGPRVSKATLRQIDSEQQTIIRTWSVSTLQVAANIGTAAIFMVSIVAPLWAAEHQNWIFAYLGTYYMGELFAWNGLTLAEIIRIVRRNP